MIACPQSSSATTTSSQTASVSPSPTPSLTGSSTLTPSASPTTSGTVSTTPKATPTPSSSLSQSPSSSTTPSQSQTPSRSPSSSRTPPPFSCLSHRDGCSAPSISVRSPSQMDGAALAVVAWPVVSAALQVILPTPPSSTETLAVTCASNDFLVVVEPTSSVFTRCPATLGACVIISPASPLSVQFRVASRSPSSAAGKIECTVDSRATPNSDNPIIYPRYGLSTTLSFPALAVNTSFVGLSSILLESIALPGVFTAIAGGGLGQAWRLSAANLSASLNCSLLEKASAANASITSVEWNSRAFLSCPSAVEAMSGVAAYARSLSSSSPPSFSVSVSGSSHMILVAPGAGGRFPMSLTARIGGIGCVVNRVSPDGAFASITTPTFADLCDALGASKGATDCGSVRLSLESESWTRTVSRLAVAAMSGNAQDLVDDVVALPTIFSPMRVGEDMASLIRAATLDSTYAATAELAAASPPKPQNPTSSHLSKI